MLPIVALLSSTLQIEPTLEPAMAWLAIVIDWQSVTIDHGAAALCLSLLMAIAVFAGVYAGMTAYDITITYLTTWEAPSLRAWEGISLRCRMSMCRRRKPVVVLVPESPPPTSHMTSPFKETMSRSEVRRRQYGEAYRAGSRRVCSHKRAAVAAYDPSRPGDCGYQCLLKAASMRPSAHNVRRLRKATSLGVEEAFYDKECLAGLNVVDIIERETGDVQEYCRNVASRQWASPVELTVAARHLGISIELVTPDGNYHINSNGQKKARHYIYMIKEHYVLKKNAGRKNVTVTEEYETVVNMGMQPTKVTRAGMRRQQEARVPQQPMFIYVNPSQLVAPPRINVMTYLHPDHDIRGGSFMSIAPLTVTRLRQLLGAMFSFQPDSFELRNYATSELIGLDDEIPHIVMMRSGQHVDPEQNFLTIHAEDGVQFQVRYSMQENHLQLLQRVATIVNRRTSDFMLVDHEMQPWIFPFDFYPDVRINLHVIRGGMRSSGRSSRSRSITPTRTYHSTQMVRRLLPEPEYDQGERPASRDSRDFEVAAAPPREDFPLLPPGLQQAVVDENADDEVQDENMAHDEIPAFDYLHNPTDETSIAVMLHPCEPPDAQPNLIRKPIREDGVDIADVWAPGMLKVTQVIRYLHEKLNPATAFLREPIGVEMWQDLSYLQAPQRTTILGEFMVDLRIGLWERFKAARVVPLVRRDIVPMKFILPREVSVHVAQQRISASAEFDQQYVLTTISDQWVVTLLPFADHVLDLVERHLPPRRYPRAGGKRGAAPVVANPKQQCIAWAHQRASEAIPAASAQTLTVLLKAEFRLSTAVMQAKTLDQVRHCVAAAYRRAGLVPPPGTPGAPSEVPDGPNEKEEEPDTKFWIAQMASAVTTQTGILTELLSSQSIMQTKGDAAQSTKEIVDVINAQHQHIKDLEKTIAELNTRIAAWETWFLPEVLDRLPSGIPKTNPATPESTPAKPLSAMSQSPTKMHVEVPTEPYSSQHDNNSVPVGLAVSPCQQADSQQLDNQGENENATEKQENHGEMQNLNGPQPHQDVSHDSSQASLPVPQIIRTLQERSQISEKKRVGGALNPFRA